MPSLNKKLYLNEYALESNSQKKSTRQGYGDGIVLAGENDKNVVVLCADLTESLRLEEFEKKFPNRFIQTGIAEQNMAGIAAGLSLCGKIPFISSYSVFNPGRNWEQVRVSICLTNANVKIVGSHSGLSPSADGPTAQALEDIAITRVLPNLTVINPIDYEQTLKATLLSAKITGPVYLRLNREPTAEITTKNTPFEIGKAYKLIEGKDLTLITTGPITFEAMKIAQTLKKHHKISCEVIAVPTIKPLDYKTIVSSVKKTQKVVTIEEHQVYGGLGGAVAEMLSQVIPTKMLILGIKDTFAESGTYGELKEKYGISEKKMLESIIKFLENKQS